MTTARERQLQGEVDRLTRENTVLKTRWQVMDRHGKGGEITKIVLAVTRAAMWIAIIYFGGNNIERSIVQTAGQKTDASFHVSGELSINDGRKKEGNEQCGGGIPIHLVVWAVGLAILFGGGCLLYARRVLKLRGEDIERLHPHQLRHEQSVDPNRSGSKLTTRGATRPEDQ